jgi:hypothetical protein
MKLAQVVQIVTNVEKNSFLIFDKKRLTVF